MALAYEQNVKAVSMDGRSWWEILEIPYNGDKCAWALTDLLRTYDQRPDVAEWVLLLSPYLRGLSKGFTSKIWNFFHASAQVVGLSMLEELNNDGNVDSFLSNWRLR